MLLTRNSHYLFFVSKINNSPKQINKFSLNKKEVVAKFEDPAFAGGIHSMALSPDANSLYIATQNVLHQFSLKDGKVIQSRNIREDTDMNWAIVYAMRVTKNNQYLVTGTTYIGSPDKDKQEEVPIGGPVCVWSTKDLTLVKT